MLQSCENTDVGRAESKLIKDQSHFEEVWKVMKPIVLRYADGFIDGMARFGEQRTPQDGYCAYIQNLIVGNDRLHGIYKTYFT